MMSSGVYFTLVMPSSSTTRSYSTSPTRGTTLGAGSVPNPAVGLAVNCCDHCCHENSDCVYPEDKDKPAWFCCGALHITQECMVMWNDPKMKVSDDASLKAFGFGMLMSCYGGNGQCRYRAYEIEHGIDLGCPCPYRLYGGGGNGGGTTGSGSGVSTGCGNGGSSTLGGGVPGGDGNSFPGRDGGGSGVPELLVEPVTVLLVLGVLGLVASAVCGCAQGGGSPAWLQNVLDSLLPCEDYIAGTCERKCCDDLATALPGAGFSNANSASQAVIQCNQQCLACCNFKGGPYASWNIPTRLSVAHGCLTNNSSYDYQSQC